MHARLRHGRSAFAKATADRHAAMAPDSKGMDLVWTRLETVGVTCSFGVNPLAALPGVKRSLGKGRIFRQPSCRFATRTFYNGRATQDKEGMLIGAQCTLNVIDLTHGLVCMVVI
jgi:hypothetical protein